MAKIEYIKGDATQPEICKDCINVICHCCNAFGGWGRGFVVPLGKRYPRAKMDYENFCKPYQDSNEHRSELMGQVCFSPVTSDLIVANLIGQYFYSKNQRQYISQEGILPKFLPTPEGRFVCYEAIEKGFMAISDYAERVDRPTTVHMPRIGCGLAGGDWAEIERLIERYLCGNEINVKVYDL